MPNSLFQYQGLATTPNQEAGAAPLPDLVGYMASPQPHNFFPHSPRQFSGMSPPRATFVADPPTNPYSGRSKAMVNRDPRIDPRVAKALDKLHEIINGLMGRGELVQVGDKGWRLNPNMTKTAARAPIATDDEDSGVMVGHVWVDTTAELFYVCVNNTAGAAVWNGPY